MIHCHMVISKNNSTIRVRMHVSCIFGFQEQNMNIDLKSALYVSIMRAWEKSLRSKMRMLSMNVCKLKTFGLIRDSSPKYFDDDWVSWDEYQ